MQGEYVTLTHQDVELSFNKWNDLVERLRNLTDLYPAWGASGNAGSVAVGESVLRMSDPHDEDRTIGNLPRRVHSLNENFIVVRRDANLCLSRDLASYRMYGPGLCVMADVQSHHRYVIDFHLRHLGGGTIDSQFRTGADAFAHK